MQYNVIISTLKAAGDRMTHTHTHTTHKESEEPFVGNEKEANYDTREHLLVEVSLFYSLLAPLECFGVLVLERLQIRHGPHALTFQTLIVMTGFGIWP